MQWLQKARLQSDSSKNKIALVSAGIITLAIVGVWLLVIKNNKTKDEVVANSKSEDLKPLFMIFSKAKTDFKDIRESVKSSKASAGESLE